MQRILRRRSIALNWPLMALFVLLRPNCSTVPSPFNSQTKKSGTEPLGMQSLAIGIQVPAFLKPSYLVARVLDEWRNRHFHGSTAPFSASGS